MFRELLAREFSPYGSLTPEQLGLLEAHYHLLLSWNRRLNLSRIGTMEDAVRLHYCESLFVATRLPSGPLSIVDVGSGAGFPGIPIAIQRPECSVTLVESHHRKCVFLHEASRGLHNVSVVTERAEKIASSYDWLVSRAVSARAVCKLQLAKNLALLAGKDALPSSQRWEPMPWGKDRYLAFHVKQSC